jgi:hypothetical protein
MHSKEFILAHTLRLKTRYIYMPASQRSLSQALSSHKLLLVAEVAFEHSLAATGLKGDEHVPLDARVKSWSLQRGTSHLRTPATPIYPHLA